MNRLIQRLACSDRLIGMYQVLLVPKCKHCDFAFVSCRSWADSNVQLKMNCAEKDVQLLISLPLETARRDWPLQRAWGFVGCAGGGRRKDQACLAAAPQAYEGRTDRQRLSLPPSRCLGCSSLSAPGDLQQYNRRRSCISLFEHREIGCPLWTELRRCVPPTSRSVTWPLNCILQTHAIALLLVTPQQTA